MIMRRFIGELNYKSGKCQQRRTYIYIPVSFFRWQFRLLPILTLHRVWDRCRLPMVGIGFERGWDGRERFSERRLDRWASLPHRVVRTSNIRCTIKPVLRALSTLAPSWRRATRNGSRSRQGIAQPVMDRHRRAAGAHAAAGLRLANRVQR